MLLRTNKASMSFDNGLRYIVLCLLSLLLIWRCNPQHKPISKNQSVLAQVEDVPVVLPMTNQFSNLVTTMADLMQASTDVTSPWPVSFTNSALFAKHAAPLQSIKNNTMPVLSSDRITTNLTIQLYMSLALYWQKTVAAKALVQALYDKKVIRAKAKCVLFGLVEKKDVVTLLGCQLKHLTSGKLNETEAVWVALVALLQSLHHPAYLSGMASILDLAQGVLMPNTHRLLTSLVAYAKSNTISAIQTAELQASLALSQTDQVKHVALLFILAKDITSTFFPGTSTIDFKLSDLLL